VIASLLASTSSVPFEAPVLDWHALAPELVLVTTAVVVLLVDLFTEEHNKWLTSSLTGIGFLAAAIPVLTLAVDG
jgi:NADH-quinone oxidoreductase subunit N